MLPNDIDQYLVARGVKDNSYQSFLFSNSTVNHAFKLCSTNGLDYMVSHFLDSSEQVGYGLIPTNEVLKTDGGNFLAIGLIEGDDVICMDIPSGAISLWMIQSGNGESLKVADSFEEFLAKCC